MKLNKSDHYFSFSKLMYKANDDAFYKAFIAGSGVDDLPTYHIVHNPLTDELDLVLDDVEVDDQGDPV